MITPRRHDLPGLPSNDPASCIADIGGGEPLQIDLDDVPRTRSTGQVFIAGSFARIPLLINDYPSATAPLQKLDD